MHVTDVQEVASKSFSLNKVLHGIDSFDEIGFPNVFLVVHSIETILSRTKYSDLMVFIRA